MSKKKFGKRPHFPLFCVHPSLTNIHHDIFDDLYDDYDDDCGDYCKDDFGG